MQSLWMLFASLMFSIMGVCVKLASDHYSIPEIMLSRGLIGMLFIIILIRFKGGTLKTPMPRQHVWRGVIGVIALSMWFYSFSLLPVATATTLNYTSSIWLAAILFGAAWWRGNSRFEWGMAFTIMLSFIGVMLLLKPSFNASQTLGAMIALASGLISAVAYLQVRHLGKLGEPEYRVVFYFSTTSAIVGLAGSLLLPGGGMPFWHAQSAYGIGLLIALSLSATVAQMAMTRAYRLGNPLLTANLQYTGIVFSSIWGIVIWQDQLGWRGWIGTAVILIGGLLATFYNQRRARPLSQVGPEPALANQSRSL
ncbi:DMT family transporter [Collimonas sp.]|jgi:drug/metabolite transporter (DMT)-like permease|uniref:DMT family transporter n=1 Tax=Collimonas sp. TaxID=1963772 RepID=UPI002C1C25CE|nr:DMT family transporter [Collimonas sp.]HWW04866.1 DMT family transporter [Collimonas sp.]